jgi:hypothetical protein
LEQQAILPTHHKVAEVGNVLAAIEPEEQEQGDVLKVCYFVHNDEFGHETF